MNPMERYPSPRLPLPTLAKACWPRRGTCKAYPSTESVPAMESTQTSGPQARALGRPKANPLCGARHNRHHPLCQACRG